MKTLIAGLALMLFCSPGSVSAQDCNSDRMEAMTVSEWNRDYVPHREAAESASAKGQYEAECDHYLAAASKTELTWVAAANTRNAAHALLKAAQVDGVSAADSKALLERCLGIYDKALGLLDVADCVGMEPGSRKKTRIDIGKGSRWARYLLAQL